MPSKMKTMEKTMEDHIVEECSKEYQVELDSAEIRGKAVADIAKTECA